MLSPSSFPLLLPKRNIYSAVPFNQALIDAVYFFGLFLGHCLCLKLWPFVSEIFYIVDFIILLTVKTADVLYFATMLGTLCFTSAPSLMALDNDNAVGTSKFAVATAQW